MARAEVPDLAAPGLRHDARIVSNGYCHGNLGWLSSGACAHFARGTRASCRCALCIGISQLAADRAIAVLVFRRGDSLARSGNDLVEHAACGGSRPVQATLAIV